MKYVAVYYQTVGETEALNLRIIEAKDANEAWEIAKKLCEVYNEWYWKKREVMMWKLSGVYELDSYHAINKKEAEEQLIEALAE